MKIILLNGKKEKLKEKHMHNSWTNYSWFMKYLPLGLINGLI